MKMATTRETHTNTESQTISENNSTYQTIPVPVLIQLHY